MAVVAITDTDLGDGSIEREILGDHTLRLLHAQHADDIREQAQDADALLVQWLPVDAATMDALPRLRAIVRYGIGMDNLDLDAAAARSITVANVPDYCLREVTAHTVALVLAHARRLRPLTDSVRAGSWTVAEIDAPFAPADDPVGVVGLGRIGLMVAHQLAALGHPVLAWDPYLSSWPDGVEQVSDVVELAGRVHHLTLHAPLTPESAAMIDARVLTALGPAGHLVNTSRGGLVNESELLASLESGALGSASLDVLTVEPPTGDVLGRLRSHPRVQMTPHAAYYSAASKINLQRRAAQIMADLLAAR
ncbi:C-terminal binding protein [Pseudactinotalea suaedae]|uniref:C-terminal binding protein n=1 Tax=Pseudactinotalea suaedae TaxID=1524924 RepID=UPI0012E1BE2A|nr:C-terminal binding protein [Pseudactinotalea suaedae]